MTEEIINKDELKNLRFLLQSGQKLAISTKEFERVFDKIDCLEQDIKRLTQWLDEARNNADFWCNKCTSLAQENKELKAQVDYLSKRETELISEITDIVADNKSFNEELIDFSKRMENQRENYYKEYNKYRSALEEIRKLTVIGVNASQCNCGLRALADDILNKINEVLNG